MPSTPTPLSIWIKAVGGITAIAHIAALGLVCVSMSGADLRMVRATADEQVSPFAVFKGLRVGSSSTCVMLHQVMNETGRWRTLETCNDLHQVEDSDLLSLRDAQTGERLTVDPICKAERDWLAMNMGIPSRVDIGSVWDKQCKETSSIDTMLMVLSIISISLAVTLAVVTLLFEETSKWWLWCMGITLPLIPVVTQAISLSMVSARTSGASLEVGATLKRSAWAVGVCSLAWAFNVVLVCGQWRSFRQQQRASETRVQEPGYVAVAKA